MTRLFSLFFYATAQQQRHCLVTGLLAVLLAFVSINGIAAQAPQTHTGVFLVATPQLHGTGFQQSVILITHYSEQGATGLTINRPSDIPLRRAFPSVRQLQQNNEPLFLGGPVNQSAVFVLTRTNSPIENMRHIVDDIYFTAGHYIQTDILSLRSRVFAGYAGWAPGQLQHEIDRGDWLIVHTNADIIFADDLDTLWADLFKAWSGTWL